MTRTTSPRTWRASPASRESRPRSLRRRSSSPPTAATIAPASEPISRATAITIAPATPNMIRTRNMSASFRSGFRGPSLIAGRVLIHPERGECLLARGVDVESPGPRAVSGPDLNDVELRELAGALDVPAQPHRNDDAVAGIDELLGLGFEVVVVLLEDPQRSADPIVPVEDAWLAGEPLPHPPFDLGIEIGQDALNSGEGEG